MTLSLLLSLALSLSNPGSAQDPSRSPDRDAGWRSDLDYIVAEAQRVHADPGRVAYSQAFESAARTLREDIPELSDDQVLARLMKLMAILDDGHTALYGAGADSPLEFERRVLPFKFYLFPSGLHIVDGDGHWVDLAGSRVVRFGELEAEEVLQRMSAYRGGDNEMTWTWMGPQFYVGRLLLLREVGVAVEDGVVEVTLVDIEGVERTLDVPAGEHELRRKLRPFPLGLGEPPMYLSNVDANYWMQPLPDSDALYFQFNQVRDAPIESIGEFSEKLRATLREGGATKLIVDVRHNNGGNNSLVRPLVRALIEFELRSPENRIYVVMGRNTFSAAQNFMNFVERWTDAVFVGEPSSSSPNFVGEENEFVLPFSRAHGSLSNIYWQDAYPWDTRPWIAPDIEVELTAEDYFSGVDPVLEQIL